MRTFSLSRFCPLQLSCTRFGVDCMKNSKENSPRIVNLQTCLAHKLQRFSIPMAAKLLCVSIVSAILPAPQPLTVTSAMLQQKNSAGRFTNPGHLMKHGNGIWERAGAKGRNSRFEALIGKGKSLRVGQQERNIHG